eukprot:g241.t1
MLEKVFGVDHGGDAISSQRESEETLMSMARGVMQDLVSCASVSACEDGCKSLLAEKDKLYEVCHYERPSNEGSNIRTLPQKVLDACRFDPEVHTSDTLGTLFTPAVERQADFLRFSLRHGRLEASHTGRSGEWVVPRVHDSDESLNGACKSISWELP